MAGGTILSTSMQEIARHDPRAVAVIDRGREVTYGELHAAAGRMAAWLARRGLGPGDMVGVTIRQELPHLVVSLGLMRLGCDQIGLASQDPVAMRADLAARVRAVAVIGDGPADALEGVSLVIPDHQAIAEDRQLDHDVLHPSGPEGTRVVFTSSGTTGRPKLFAYTEDAFRVQAAHGWRMGGRSHIPASIEFALPRRLLFTSLAAGGCTIFPDPGGDLLSTVRRFAPARVMMTPRRAETLVHEVMRAGAPDPWPDETALMVSGAPVPGALRRSIQDHLTPQLYVPYGTNECPFISMAFPEDHQVHPDGVGRPFRAEVIIVDEEGTQVPAQRYGFVRARRPGMAHGYLGDPDASSRAFLPGGWFQPGDVALIESDGTILFGDRADDMMTLGTIKIMPHEIEAVAAGFPGILECAAFPMRSPAHGDVPMLAVVARADACLDEAVLMAHCRARLGMRAPRKILVVARLPRNAAGKVLRRELSLAAAAQGTPRNSGSG